MSELPPADGLTFTKTYHFSQKEIDEFVARLGEKGYKILNVPEFIKEYVRSCALEELVIIFDDHFYGSGCGLEEMMDDKHNGVLFEVVDEVVD